MCLNAWWKVCFIINVQLMVILGVMRMTSVTKWKEREPSLRWHFGEDNAPGRGTSSGQEVCSSFLDSSSFQREEKLNLLSLCFSCQWQSRVTKENFWNVPEHRKVLKEWREAWCSERDVWRYGIFLDNLKERFSNDRGTLLVGWLFLITLLFYISKWRAVGIWEWCPILPASNSDFCWCYSIKSTLWYGTGLPKVW